jgi:hypothetical protein
MVRDGAGRLEGASRKKMTGVILNLVTERTMSSHSGHFINKVIWACSHGFE